MVGKRRGRPRYPGTFTPAEQRVLDELRHGRSNAEIAVRLGLSPETVKYHVANMLAKTGASDRGELAALESGGGTRRGRWALVGLGAAAAVAGVLALAALLAPADDAGGAAEEAQAEGQLAFVGLSPFGASTVSVMPAEGGEMRRLTSDPRMQYFSPLFSPDGRLITYLAAPARCDSPEPRPGRCATLEVAFGEVPGRYGSSGEVQVSLHPFLGVVQRPTWSPHGGVIVASMSDIAASFSTYGAGLIAQNMMGCPSRGWAAAGTVAACSGMSGNESSDIFLFPVDETFRPIETPTSPGGGMELEWSRSIRWPGVDMDPVFSPDGKWLVWWNQDEDGVRRVMYANIEGEEAVILDVKTAGEGMRAEWSPDSRYLLFSTAKLNGDETNEELAAIDSGIVVYDVRDEEAEVVVTGGANIYPDWSPDGKRFAFVSDREGTFEIYLADRDGSGVVRLTFNEMTETMLDWSPR